MNYFTCLTNYQIMGSQLDLLLILDAIFAPKQQDSSTCMNAPSVSCYQTAICLKGAHDSILEKHIYITGF